MGLLGRNYIWDQGLFKWKGSTWKVGFIYFIYSIFNSFRCYSIIGRDGGRQDLSLGDGCYRKGIAVHETLHLLGFFHEQSRLDRDEHVTVHYYNTLESRVISFLVSFWYPDFSTAPLFCILWLGSVHGKTYFWIRKTKFVMIFLISAVDFFRFTIIQIYGAE